MIQAGHMCNFMEPKTGKDAVPNRKKARKESALKFEHESIEVALVDSCDSVYLRISPTGLALLR